jgi:mannose-1-phosphate guanylyltransferase
MSSNNNRWVVVLAAGAGTRLSSLTRNRSGDYVPKQFCSFAGAGTLLEDTLRRATEIADPERIIVIVDPRHRDWWQPLLQGLPADNVIEQPQNRGTAIGVLLAVLHVRKRDPDARIAFLPSDHFVREEAAIVESLRAGFEHIDSDRNALVLLGISPEESDPELGYVVPGAPAGGSVFLVERFVEKPSRELAEELLARGSRWNSFIFAARAVTFCELYSQRYPEILQAVRLALLRDGWASRGAETLQAVYTSLPETDFSRQLLQGAERQLRMLPVRHCGWTDLGTPARVGKCLAQLGVRALKPRAGERRRYPNLANAYARIKFAV